LKVVGKGRVGMAEYRLLPDRVAVVSVMWANNGTGSFFPVPEMAELANAAGVMFHTDAVQAVGKVPIDLQAKDRHAVAVGPQTARAQGNRRAVPQARHLVRYEAAKSAAAAPAKTPSIVALGRHEMALRVAHENTEVRHPHKPKPASWPASRLATGASPACPIAPQRVRTSRARRSCCS
jgi:cysteine desulfurase